MKGTVEMIDTKKLMEILQCIIRKIEAEKEFLTELDNAIGDGDHGINLSRGFQKVAEKLSEWEGQDVGSVLKGVGTQLVSTVGGASGPLYGTAFMKAGNACKGKQEISGEEFAAAMEAAIGGIRMRGKSQEGEKTMLDALCPAHRALTAALTDGKDLKSALKDAIDAAAKGVEYTKTIIATKGRASYLGERSIGHQDPGATSSLFILQAMEEAL